MKREQEFIFFSSEFFLSDQNRKYKSIKIMGESMRKLLILFLLLGTLVFSQEKDTTLYRWEPSLITGVNISQISFKDWSKGGENAITWTLTGDFQLTYKTESWKFKNQLKAAYGRTKLGSATYKTNDNELYLESVLSHRIGWAVNPFISNTVRTQITKGYDYDTDPVTEIADFFDPGYITQSIGFTYDHNGSFTSRLGLAFQEVITNSYTHYTDDTDTPDEVETFKFETGIESSTDAKLTVAENVEWKTKFRLFSRFETLEVWDVRWDNTVTATVNSWLNVNFTFLLIYEKAQSLKTQMKEALQIGIVYKIL